VRRSRRGRGPRVLALRIEFLTGRYVAASFDDRDVPEWPPHPTRVFSALTAALAEGGGDPEERSALEWLERQPPPALVAGQGVPRAGYESFVPVNDTADPKKGPPSGEGFPVGRGRQRRTFASSSVDPPVVYLVWEHAAASSEASGALSRVTARVSYLGHSSSLVSIRVTDEAPAPTLVPASDGETVLRVPAAGLLEMLEHAHRVYVETGNRGPLPTEFWGYKAPDRGAEVPRAPRSVFGEVVVLRRVEGTRLPITAAERVAQVLRAAVMAAHPDPVPEVVSGHRVDGFPSDRPHVAFLALPDVGHPHAGGHLMGVAVALPRAMTPSDRASTLRALGAVRELTFGRAGVWRLKRAVGSELQSAVRTTTWTRSSARWATVTPIELDIHPSEPYGTEAEASVARSCERIGLTRPVRVLLLGDPVMEGAAPWHAFRRPGERRRPLVHAVVEFETPVEGPVLLGSSRYRGLGLCRPVGRWREGGTGIGTTEQ
jgi:CRISPR-associated protein Csb2